jgi:hypothetical protein
MYYFSPYQSTIVPNLPEAETDLVNFLKDPSSHKIKITVCYHKKTSHETYLCYTEYFFTQWRNSP